MRVREGITNDYHIQENAPGKIYRMENEADEMTFKRLFNLLMIPFFVVFCVVVGLIWRRRQ